MRMYAHFLGYSAAEGGVVEIFTQDTFGMGSLDILTGEREFDDIEFTVPYSSIFDMYQPQCESFYLHRKMYGGLVSFSVENANAFKAEGLRPLVVGDKLWVENERIEVIDTDYTIGTTGGFYLASRGLNGSAVTSHFFNDAYSQGSNVVMTTKRLRPIGLIVKIYDDSGKVYALGQLNECTISNSSTVTVKCKNLYSQLDASMVIQSSNGAYNSIFGCVQLGYVDFFTFFDYISLPINALFKYDDDDGQYAKIDNVKKAFEQLLLVNNYFLTFDTSTGRYVLKSMRKLVGGEVPVDKLLGDVVLNNGGVVECSTFPHISTCNIKTQDGDITISSFDSNYTSEYTQGQDISIDLSSIILSSGFDVDAIARDKLFFIAGIIERMEISSSRYNSTFVVGGYYRFLDIYKYATFYSNINDNVFLCLGMDEVKVSFIRVLSFTSSLVAPAIMVKKTGDYTFSLLDSSDEGFFAYLATTESSLITARNQVTQSLFFEIDDEITLFDADNNVFRPIIGDIDETNVYTVTNVGTTGKYYMMSIESNKAFSALQTKNKAYIYEGEGVL